MTAEPREELLSAYLDDELSPEDRARVEQWLVDDAEYRRLFEELRAVRRDLQALPRHKLPADLSAAVLRRAERTVLVGDDAPAIAGAIAPRSAVAEWWSRGRTPRMFLWPALAVAAAVLVALFDARRDGQRDVVLQAPRDMFDAAERDAARAVEGLAEAAADPLSMKGADAAAAPEAARPAAGPAGEAFAKGTDVSGTPGQPAEENAAPSLGKRSGSVVMRGRSAATAPYAQGHYYADPAAAPEQQLLQSTKLETNVSRALANKEQVNFIQADVSPEFLKEKRIEKVLSANSRRFAIVASPQELERLEAKDAAELARRKVLVANELRFTCEATPQQVEQIVTELEQERVRERVSNLIVGLQERRYDPSKVVAGTPLSLKDEDKVKLQNVQQPVMIYLRQMDAAASAGAATPALKASER
jgi:anti-sigma factor RsiW